MKNKNDFKHYLDKALEVYQKECSKPNTTEPFIRTDTTATYFLTQLNVKKDNNFIQF